jgi:hypothetical protein
MAALRFICYFAELPYAISAIVFNGTVDLVSFRDAFDTAVMLVAQLQSLAGPSLSECFAATTLAYSAAPVRENVQISCGVGRAKLCFPEYPCATKCICYL